MFGFSCAEWTIPNVLIRIVVSMILGCVIGLDRGLKKRGAGTKTNTIVCLGADRKSTRLNSSHSGESRMPSSA